ncbi:hypothetical protein Desaci_1713 [Desulfosporosinus acidiphilus SJ4]|uniref:Uncharacterized protein n=1 Tax=Desulfosporosinus acidiphilus (strain DSM 22704 / JCM 16185 / SJ4) TaxID=646529 RepID=I4D4H8_DESAJ|nr:hypothetical protein [Desulfosporosinus acidiphilus]AFM40702.1 hypothetical protein Desaci_1713 [Desulfosporosinus acidiphilus SJ4]
MPNITWYCIPALIGLSATVYTIFTKRKVYKLSTFIVFYLFSTGVTWIGEFVVLGLFNSYAYRTGIFPSPWAQNLLGHLILNSTFYPGTAILVGAYSLGLGWISLITILYLFFEYLFLKLGIYVHHWWKYYMTGIIILVYQFFSKIWFKKMDKMQHGWLKYITFYLVGFVLLHYPAPILLLWGKQYYNVHWVSDLYLSSTLFIFSYQLVESLIYVFFVCVLNNWYWKIVPYLVALIGQSVLLSIKVLVVCDGWSFLYTVLVYYLSITAFIVIEKNFLPEESPTE